MVKTLFISFAFLLILSGLLGSVLIIEKLTINNLLRTEQIIDQANKVEEHEIK